MHSTPRSWALLASLAVTAFAEATSSDLYHHGHPKIPSQSHQTLVIPNSVNTWPYQTYKSSNLQPPYMNFTGDSRLLDPGYLFLNPNNTFTAIMDNDGQLVYGLTIGNGTPVTGFRVQEYNGKPHLTVWNGFATSGVNFGHSYGTVAFFDQEYNMTTSLDPTIPINTLQTFVTPGLVDEHESQMAPSGESMIVTAFNNTPADLSEFGIEDGWVLDSLVYDIDVTTQEVLFLWNAHDHGVPYNASLTPLDIASVGNGTEGAPWDWCNILSATKVNGNYLIGSRHLWTIWYVDGTDGSIIWEINGANGGDFGPLPDGATFSWQHYARPVSFTEDSITLSIFNNHDNTLYPVDVGQTTGLVLEYSLPPNKLESPKVLRNISVASEPIYTGTQGTFTPSLSNGNAFMGYGSVPICREYGSVVDGTNQALIGEWRFGLDGYDQSFRGFKMGWQATPAGWDPSVVVESSTASNALNVYASWNGATDITAWNVAAGASMDDLQFIGQAEKYGFETAFNVSSAFKCVQVTAVSGETLVRKSNIACT